LQLALHLLAMAGLLPNGTLPAVDYLVAMVLAVEGLELGARCVLLCSGSNLEKPRIV
jgi:hypothetical protein